MISNLSNRLYEITSKLCWQLALSRVLSRLHLDQKESSMWLIRSFYMWYYFHMHCFLGNHKVKTGCHQTFLFLLLLMFFKWFLKNFWCSFYVCYLFQLVLICIISLCTLSFSWSINNWSTPQLSKRMILIRQGTR